MFIQYEILRTNYSIEMDWLKEKNMYPYFMWTWAGRLRIKVNIGNDEELASVFLLTKEKCRIVPKTSKYNI